MVGSGTKRPRSDGPHCVDEVAALGDCAVCHTSADGALNAGGRPLQTPFGTIYATNITPDVETGIGSAKGFGFGLLSLAPAPT